MTGSVDRGARGGAGQERGRPPHRGEHARSVAALQNVVLFSEFAAEELEGLAGSLRPRRFARGECIFLAGDPGDSLCIIEEGRVRIALPAPDGRGEVTVAVLGPGDFFGELALLDGHPRSADAVGTEAGRLLLLRRADFLGCLEERPRMAIRLLGVLSQRLRHDAELVQDAAFLDVPGRLARVLLRLAEAQGQRRDEAVLLSTRLTQTDLAGLVGATRESVNKWVGFYERQGLIRCQGGQITVLRPDGLRARIS